MAKAKLPADRGPEDMQNIMINHKARHPMRDARRLEERSGNRTQREIAYYEKLNQYAPITITKLSIKG